MEQRRFLVTGMHPRTQHTRQVFVRQDCMNAEGMVKLGIWLGHELSTDPDSIDFYIRLSKENPEAHHWFDPVVNRAVKFSELN